MRKGGGGFRKGTGNAGRVGSRQDLREGVDLIPVSLRPTNCTVSIPKMAATQRGETMKPFSTVSGVWGSDTSIRKGSKKKIPGSGLGLGKQTYGGHYLLYKR